MNFALSVWWKEYREQRPFFLAITLLAGILVLTLVTFMSPLGPSHSHQNNFLRTSLVAILLILNMAYAVVCGAMLLVNDRETGTQPFVDALPVSRSALWTAKVSFGLLLVLTEVLVLFLITLYVELPAPNVSSLWLLMLLGLALEGYCWALCAAPLARTVLAAAALSVVLILATLILAILVSVWTTPVIGVPVQLIAGLVLSRYLYCAPDRRRRAGAAALGANAAQSSWHVLLWLCWRQGRVQLAIMLGCALVLGTVLPWCGMWLWPLATLVIGAVCGTEVFADENATLAYRFLGSQRFPGWRVWLVKTLFWFVAAALTAALLMLGCALVLASTFQPGMTRAAAAEWSLAQLWSRWQEGQMIAPFYFFTLWLVYGFSAGLISSQLMRKRAVALVLAAGGSALILAVWLPTLICRGWSAWQLFAIPAFFVAASAWSFRTWLGDRLTGKRLALGVVVGVLLVAGWLGGNLCYRAFGIPDVGEPFDVRAYLQELAAASKSNAPWKIRQAVSEMKEQERKATKKFGPSLGGSPPAGPAPAVPPPQPEQPGGEPAAPMDLHSQLAEAMEKGWPKEKTKLDEWMDAIFASSWVSELDEAVKLPPGLLTDPRTVTFSSTLDHLQDCRAAAYFLTGRALQLQARGQHKEALDHILTTLALSRHLRTHPIAMQWLVGTAVEANALDALETWLAGAKAQKELLPIALAALQEHSRSNPPVLDVIKAEYLMFRDNLPQWIAEFKNPELTLAKLVPWEQERDRRTLNLIFQRRLQMLEVPPHQRFTIMETESDGKKIYYIGELPAKGSLLDRERDHLQKARFVRGEIWGPFADGANTDFKILRISAQSQYRVAAAQIRLALAQYEADEGQPAVNLGQLAPKYLSAIPVNPFTGQPFTKVPPKLEREGPPAGTPGTPVAF